MTKAQRRALARYLATLKREMWLGPWRIDLLWEDVDRDCHAEIEPTFGQRHANLRVARDFFESPPEKQRSVLVHELLHCHLADVQHHAQGVEPLLGRIGYDAWMLGFRSAVEHAVDALTLLLAAGMPLPALPPTDTGPVVVE